MPYRGERVLDKFMALLKENGHQMQPSSAEELEGLMRSSQGRFSPQAYVEFMKNAGNGIRFFRGSSFTMKEISNLKEWAIELLKDNGSEEVLTENDFVVFMVSVKHQIT